MPVPVDYRRAVHGAILSRVQTGITAYNLAVNNGDVQGPLVPAGMPWDDQDLGRIIEKIHKNNVQGPVIALRRDDFKQDKTSTPTFGLAQAVANCDAIIPETIKHQLSVIHRYKQDSKQTPIERFLEGALMAGYPKLGLTYCKGYSISTRSRDEKVGNQEYVASHMTITVELVLHKANLALSYP